MRGPSIGFDVVLSLALVGFTLFVWIPHYGGQIAQLCSAHPHCRHFSLHHDTGDSQWDSFHRSAHLLGVYFLINCVTKLCCARNHQIPLRIFFGVVFIVILHGYQAVIILLIAYGGFLLAQYFKFSPPHLKAVVVWSYAALVLTMKESYRWQRQFPFVQILFGRRYGGIYSWHLASNFLVLRMLSFQIDSSQTNEQLLNTYSLSNYFAYVLYWPLYMAGPIVPYHQFIQDLVSGGESVSLSKHWIYFLRLVFSYFVMRTLSYAFPVFAIQRSRIFYSLSPPQLAVYLYLTLQMMWLKFLLIWRYFTLFARLDGVNAPENMLRCVSNNYSLSMFWRGWHASFNKWITRYMYLPLGGRDNPFSLWIIFVFVAMWHDFDIKLLTWGLLNAAFHMVEIIGRIMGKSSCFEALSGCSQLTLRVIAGGIFVLMLMGVNLIGYAFGVDEFLHAIDIFSKDYYGISTMVTCFAVVCAAVRVMMAIDGPHSDRKSK